jgi:methionyl-tRNA formyltransferase
MAPGLRIAFAGDRDISTQVLARILGTGVQPLALMIPGFETATHATELVGLCPFLQSGRVLVGKEYRQPEGLFVLQMLDLDLIIAIHFPYIIPKEILSIPRQGVLNLHPAYLPYNRGWHTPSWAILDGTPIGATLHFMDEGIDTGDIVHRKELTISPGDTAHSLYQQLKKLELEVFEEAWPSILNGSYARIPQSPIEGTTH